MTKPKKRDLFSELKQGLEEIQEYKKTKKNDFAHSRNRKTISP